MIYFVQCGENGPIKIGRTIGHFQKRLSVLQSNSPYEIIKLGIINDQDLSDKEVHKKFTEEHIRGEWFHPSSKIKKYIKESCMPGTLNRRALGMVDE